MSFEIGVVGQFTARHHLVGNFGPANQPHEHRYRLEAEVSGAVLQPDGTLFDISRLQAAMAEVIAELDGHNLNDLDGLGDPNPTAEVLARYVGDRISPAVSGQGLDQLKTTIWESPEAYARSTRELV